MASISKLTLLLTLALLSSCGKDGPAPTLGCSQCKIFVTAVAYNGNLGGVEGADEKCMTDANKPAGDSEYKAQITDFTYRSFEDPGWVFQANTPYYRPDGTLIGTTNSLAQMATLDNPASTSAVSAWTGGDPRHCNFWRSSLNADFGLYGTANSTTNFGYTGSLTCDQTAYLYCVEQ